jgi:hypothetical protein
MENRPVGSCRAWAEIHAAIRTIGAPSSQLSNRPPVNTTQSSPYKGTRMRKGGDDIKPKNLTRPVGFICQPAVGGISSLPMLFFRRACFLSCALGFQAPCVFGSPDTKLMSNIGIYLY